MAYAKTLSAWQEHFHGSLKAMRENSSVPLREIYCRPCKLEKLKTSVGWLIQRQPRNNSQSANAAATMEQVEQEIDEDQDFIYINPGGQRCTSLQQALQYVQNDKLRNRLAADMQTLQIDNFAHNSNIHVQFTSNYEN